MSKRDSNERTSTKTIVIATGLCVITVTGIAAFVTQLIKRRSVKLPPDPALIKKLVYVLYSNFQY